VQEEITELNLTIFILSESFPVTNHTPNQEHAIYPEPPYFPLFSLRIITPYTPIILVLGIRSIRKTLLINQLFTVLTRYTPYFE
jgi:hypothetical protein